MTNPAVSIVMPVYNTAEYVCAAIESVLAQTFRDFELLIIDDGGQDTSLEICQNFDDPRIRIISQGNRGLAGARNTGIRHAQGAFIAFLDSDDLWEAGKLEHHVGHLRGEPSVGVSFAASRLINEQGDVLSIVQSPKLKNLKAQDIFLRNPVGNGSAPVIRREVFEEIASFNRARGEHDYFDETFSQSEDIECWMRIALTTSWRFEGIEGAFTRYRINEGGLSANVIRQFQTWRRVRARVAELNPGFARRWADLSEAFQLRYLARRCIRMGDGSMAWTLVKDAVAASPALLVKEPAKTLTTLMAAAFLRFTPDRFNAPVLAALQKG